MVRHDTADPSATLLSDAGSDGDDAGLQIEGWVAGALGGRRPSEGGFGSERWELGLRAPRPSQTAAEQGTAVPGSGWERFKQVSKGDVTVLRLLDRNLLRDGEVRELADDLLCLVAAGHTRIVVNCAGIERLSSWVVGAVAAAHKRCVAADGGAVRICGLRPEVASAFAILGAKGVGLFTDEASALEAPWPERSRPRALPVSLLTSVTAEEPVAPRPAATAGECEPAARPAVAPASGPAVRLVARGGRSDGKTVVVGASRLVIGRDAGCAIRLASADVSRFHAAVDRRDGGVFLRDLGSTNGTLHNGRKLAAAEAELRDGDRVKIGPLRLSVVFGPADAEADVLDDSVAGWLLDGAPAPASPTATTDDLPSMEAVDPGRIVRCEVIEGVTVIAPRASDLEDESTLGPLRAGLQILTEPPVPSRVVVNLECVARLSEQAIGLLVAHHLRLHRAGGALRIAAAPVRLMARLEQVRLPELVPCYVTVDDAVLCAWPATAEPQPTESASGPDEAPWTIPVDGEV